MKSEKILNCFADPGNPYLVLLFVELDPGGCQMLGGSAPPIAFFAGNSCWSVWKKHTQKKHNWIDVFGQGVLHLPFVLRVRDEPRGDLLQEPGLPRAHEQHRGVSLQGQVGFLFIYFVFFLDFCYICKSVRSNLLLSFTLPMISYTHLVGLKFFFVKKKKSYEGTR